MGKEDYIKAYKLGKKDYQTRLLKGMSPVLPVLDDMLPSKGSYAEVSLGLVQIPTDLIVGTKTEGRSSAFSANFMPILRDGTEFSKKWASLSTSHVQEGIREPIKAYEYMNRFYVLEGNKRVSVMKYYGVVSIPGTVIRILPKRTDDLENKIYYEFVDFYNLSKVNYIWFSKLGSFKEIQKAVGKAEDEVWTREDQLNFSSIYSRFTSEYHAKGGEKLSITPGDAFLAFLTLYGYEAICDMTMVELKELIHKVWQEFVLLQQSETLELQLEPKEEKVPLLKRLISGSIDKVKVAFIYERNPSVSAWSYAHELGRLHLEHTFSDDVETGVYENVTIDTIEETLEGAVEEGYNIIFTTTPAFVNASLKAAVDHPDIKILNCSLNISHKYIRTYYARMYEAKFIMGAIAGIMTDTDKIVYLADYPIYGTIANINAFALGVKMVNPKAKVYLEWSSVRNTDVVEKIEEVEADVISGQDMVIPEEASRYFGLYKMEGEYPKNLAMPLWHWGRFYEELIRKVMDGTWSLDENTSNNRAINYWWGMSAEVIDIICSKSLPAGVLKLVSLLKKNVLDESFQLFSGELRSQDGIIRKDGEPALTLEEVIEMDWLDEIVIGSIPHMEELEEKAMPVMMQQGVRV